LYIERKRCAEDTKERKKILGFLGRRRGLGVLERKKG
jgi:hypothetical protein